MDYVIGDDFIGKQIYIRGLEKEDLLYRTKWFNDSDINKTLLMEYPISYSGTLEWFNRSLKEKRNLNFSICDIDNDKVIGMTGLLNLNRLHRKAQFYITIGEKNYWGRKIPNEVIPIILNYGFHQHDLNKIYLWTIRSNDRARKIYEHNMFKQEGILREDYFCRGEYNDIIQHSILKKEWIKK